MCCSIAFNRSLDWGHGGLIGLYPRAKQWRHYSGNNDGRNAEVRSRRIRKRDSTGEIVDLCALLFVGIHRSGDASAIGHRRGAHRCGPALICHVSTQSLTGFSLDRTKAPVRSQSRLLIGMGDQSAKRYVLRPRALRRREKLSIGVGWTAP